MKKLLALLLALIMVCSLAACGGGKNDTQSTPAAEAATGAPETIAPDASTPAPETKEETASIPGAIEIKLPEGESVVDANLLDGVFYIAANAGGDPDDFYNSNKIYTAGMDGSAPTPLYTHDDYSIDSFTPSRDGSVWLRTYHFDQDGGDAEQTLIHVGADGAVLATVDVDALGMEYIPEMYPAADGGVLLVGGMNLVTLDSAGNTANSAALTDYLGNLIVLPDGQLAALQRTIGLEGTSSTVFVKVDPATGAVTPIPDQSEQDLNYASPLCADGNTLWFTRMSTVYTLDMTTGAETELYSLVNAGINTYDMKTCFVKDGNLWSAEAPEGTIIGPRKSAGSGTLTVFPARTGEDTRTVLTLATMRTDYNLTPLVAQFNRVNQQYRIEVKDYTADDPWYDHALEKLNYDIIGGDIPDMYLLDSMPRATLTKQGLLADLSPYLESDSDIRMEDYFSKIIDASREDGQLLSLFASFWIDTLAALPGQSVTVENNTLENLFALQTQDMNTAVLQCSEGERANMAASLLIHSPEGMIDLESASCSFDGVKFRALAEMFATMPVTQYDGTSGQIVSQAPYRLFTDYLSSYGDAAFDNLNGWSPAIGPAQPIDQSGSTLVGWPGPDGGVHSVTVTNEFAISSRSAHPDACWDFLRQFLQDGYQAKLLERDEGFALKRGVMADGAALLVQYDNMTQEQIDTVNALFESDRLRVDHASVMDEIYTIVVEELTPYYDGAAGLDTVAANLQSRVGLYLSEQS